MKKLISILLALVFVLSMATVTFAETQEWDGEYAATDPTSFEEIIKTYTSEGNVIVTETLSFTSTANTANPDGGANNLTVDNLDVSALNAGTLKVNVPSLPAVGKYEWTIKETGGTTAGVIYSNAEIHIIALVEYNNDAHKLQIHSYESYIKLENNNKAKTFENVFQSGSFTVAKNVEGNMANETDKFEIKVTLTSDKPIGTTLDLAGTQVAPDAWTVTNGTWTYTHTGEYCEKDGAKTFSNIPVGVVVTVAETQTADKMNGYDYTSTKIGTADFTSLTVADDTNAAIVVTNTKTTNVETGIVLDSMPYFVMLAVACAGMFLLVSKKRMMREN